MPSIDWKNVTENEFVLLPEGDYTVVIESVEIKQTTKQDEMWRLKMNITEGQFAGQKIFTNLIFNEGGYGNIKKLYSVIFGSKLPKNCETSDIIDEKITVSVVHTEYNGKTYANVAYAGFKSVDDDEDPFQ